MAFIRKKKINEQYYGYIVKNKWTSKGSRQKAKYIGKVIHLPIVNEISFEEYCNNNFNYGSKDYIRKNSKTEIINEIIKLELIKRGLIIEKIEIKDSSKIKKIENCLTNGDYYYKGRRLFKKSTNKEVVLEMNEGFLCRFSTDRLLRVKIIGYDEREKGIKLAKALLEAGLKVENEVFVLLFEKWS
jgi:hypothetical protein